MLAKGGGGVGNVGLSSLVQNRSVFSMRLSKYNIIHS